MAKAPFADTIEALGTVQANESVILTSNRADHVASIHFEDGQSVKKGDLLVAMHAKEERAMLGEAKAIRDDRELNHTRMLDLLEKELTSQREYDAAKALLAGSRARVLSLEAAIADREIRAPFDGVLGLRKISVGTFLQSSTRITTLDDLSVVKLDFTVPEAWLPNVRPGMSIKASSVAWPDQVFTGTVKTLDTRLNRSTRAATFRAHMPNPGLKLRPGMLLKISIDRGDDPVLQVPEEALILTGASHFVLRVTDDVARRVPVEIGRRRVGTVEIESGLEPGDQVVVVGIVSVAEGIVDNEAGIKVKITEVRRP